MRASFRSQRARREARHRPAEIKPWLGDSVGWWEGDTLVVETINVHPEQASQGQIILSPQGKVTETFERAGDGELYYAFTVEDPVYYTQTWKAEETLNRREASVYEYACHEGNYAMQGILGGARIPRLPDARTSKAPAFSDHRRRRPNPRSVQ